MDFPKLAKSLLFAEIRACAIVVEVVKADDRAVLQERADKGQYVPRRFIQIAIKLDDACLDGLLDEGL